MTTHEHSNPTLHDLEKDENHEGHALNTAQHSLDAIERGRLRAQKDAAALIAHNVANAKGFPEDD